MWNELSTSFNDLFEEDYNIVSYLLDENEAGFIYFLKNFTSTSRSSNDKHKLNSSLCDSILVALIKSNENIGQNIMRNAICPVPTVVNDYEHDHVTKLISLYGGMDDKLWTDLQSALQMIKESRDKRTFKSSKMKTDERESEHEDQNTRSSLPPDLDGDCRVEDRRITENKSRCSVLQLVVDNWAILTRDMASSERSVCKRASVVQNDTVSLTLDTDVEMVATTERTEKVSTLADLLTGFGRTAQSNIPEYYSANLGKRGRYYLDVWEEQQYLASAQSSSSWMLSSLMSVENWSQLLHSYRDAHDGAYRDWMLAAITEEHAELLATQSSGGKKKSRKIDPIFSRPGVQGLTEQSKALLSRIRPPPVPTSVQHPASWAIGRLETEDFLPSSDEKCASFDCVHPASVRSATAVVHPPFSQQNRQGGTANSPDRVAKKRRLGINRASSADDWVEDVDDFSVLAEHLSRQLDTIEAANFSRLQRTKHLATIDGQLKAMRVRRLALENVVYRALRKNEPKNSERVIYASLRSRRGAETILQPYLGACLAKHVPFGSILESMLQVNSFVEARLQQQWRICRVMGLQRDGELLRHVKVCPVNGLPSSSVWIAVEDGQLAPRGTHTHWAGGAPTGVIDVSVSGGDSNSGIGCHQVTTSATEFRAAPEHKECPDAPDDAVSTAALNQQDHRSPHKYTPTLSETQNEDCCDENALRAIRLATARDVYPQLIDLQSTGFRGLSPAIPLLPSYSHVFKDDEAFRSSHYFASTAGVNQGGATTFRISSTGHLTKNE